MNRFSSCLQQLAESPTFTRLKHLGKGGKASKPKSAPTTQHRNEASVSTPPSPLKLSFLDDSHEAKPFFANLSTTNGESLSKAATHTTTGIDSLANDPSTRSVARSTDHHPQPLPPLVKIAGPSTPRLDFSVDAFRLSEYVVDREAALSKAFLRLPEPPVLARAGGGGSTGGQRSNAPTAYYSLSESRQGQSMSASSSFRHGVSSPHGRSPTRAEAERDDHDKYLESLKLLQFGDDVDPSPTGGFALERLGGSFQLVVEEEREGKRYSASLSWEKIDLSNYGWGPRR